jgi:hypothetical protein
MLPTVGSSRLSPVSAARFHLDRLMPIDDQCMRAIGNGERQGLPIRRSPYTALAMVALLEVG